MNGNLFITISVTAGAVLFYRSYAAWDRPEVTLPATAANSPGIRSRHKAPHVCVSS
jgi:hypothetical protein